MNVIIGGRALLEDAKLRLTYGRKYGLIGRNGIGKTCFMNALARSEFENMPRHLQILLVEQEMKGSNLSPIQFVRTPSKNVILVFTTLYKNMLYF